MAGAGVAVAVKLDGALFISARSDLAGFEIERGGATCIFGTASALGSKKFNFGPAIHPRPARMNDTAAIAAVPKCLMSIFGAKEEEIRSSILIWISGFRGNCTPGAKLSSTGWKPSSRSAGRAQVSESLLSSDCIRSREATSCRSRHHPCTAALTLPMIVPPTIQEMPLPLGPTSKFSTSLPSEVAAKSSRGKLRYRR